MASTVMKSKKKKKFFFNKADLSFLPYLPIYSVISLYRSGLMDIYFTLCIIIQTLLFMLVLTLFQPWLLGVLTVDICVLLTYTIIVGWLLFFKHLLIFWHYKMIHAHLLYFPHQSLNPPYPQGYSWFLLLQNGVRY